MSILWILCTTWESGNRRFASAQRPGEGSPPPSIMGLGIPFFLAISGAPMPLWELHQLLLPPPKSPRLPPCPAYPATRPRP